MKFTVTRTSSWDSSKNPAPELNLTTEKVHYGNNNTDLFDVFVIEINTLEELMDFINKVNNPIVIEDSDYKEIQMEIEIYDDYRE